MRSRYKKLEERLLGLDQRFGGIEQKIGGIEQKIGDAKAELRALIDMGSPVGKFGNISTLDAGRLPRLSLYNRLGMTLLLDRNSVVDRFVIQTGAWELDQLKLVRAAIQYFNDPRIYFIDIGAYWGLYSLIPVRDRSETSGAPATPRSP